MAAPMPEVEPVTRATGDELFMLDTVCKGLLYQAL